MATPLEGRTFSRKDVKVGVIYWLEKKSEKFKIDGASLTLNISGGGILIRMFHPVEMGSTIFLKFMLEKSVIQCVGKVARLEQVPGARAWNVGIQLELKPEDQSTVTQFIEQSSQ